MILKKFLLKAVFYQLLRIPIFLFMLFFIHYVFKTRSIKVVYFFAFILGGIFVFSLFKIFFCSVRFIFTLTAFKKKENFTLDGIEAEFLSQGGILGRYFLLEKCFIIFEVSLTDTELRLVPFSQIRSVEKTKAKKENTMVITLGLEEEELEGKFFVKNRYITLVFCSEDEKSQGEFNSLYLKLKTAAERA